MKTNVKFLNLFTILGLIIGITTSCDKDVPLTGIDLDQVEANVMVGATLNLNVVFNPIDATNKNITWESSNTSAATVADGVVTGVALGEATITATSQENNALQATCEILVVPSNGQQINVSGDITTDTKWYANARYFLSGFVYVKNNATLTIEPGTIIKGVSGTKGSLIIERGSKIDGSGNREQTYCIYLR